MKDTKEDFCRHLCRLGFEIGASREWVQQKFRRHIGDERFAAFERIAQGLRGGTNDDPLYDFVQDNIEANLLRSIDPDVTVDTSYHLYQWCRPLLKAGTRVLELACWTGGLTSFIAVNHPQSQVAGVDRVERVIGLNRAQHQLPNLTFQSWDYRHEKPAEVESADVLICGLGINNLPDGGYEDAKTKGLRASAGYQRHKADAAIYFRNWRSAAKPGATLLAVLRMNSFGRYMAYVDAACEAGWTPELSSWMMVTIPTAKQAIPALRFVAREAALLPEDHLLTNFVRLMTPGSPYAQLVDGLALAVYQGLTNRKVLRVVNYHGQNGVPTCSDEIGVAGSFGYIFWTNGAPQYRLSLISAVEAESRAAQWQPGQQSQITYSLPSGAQMTTRVAG